MRSNSSNNRNSTHHTTPVPLVDSIPLIHSSHRVCHRTVCRRNNSPPCQHWSRSTTDTTRRNHCVARHIMQNQSMSCQCINRNTNNAIPRRRPTNNCIQTARPSRRTSCNRLKPQSCIDLMTPNELLLFVRTNGALAPLCLLAPSLIEHSLHLAFLIHRSSSSIAAQLGAVPSSVQLSSTQRSAAKRNKKSPVLR